jgi:hypothetical protein
MADFIGSKTFTLLENRLLRQILLSELPESNGKGKEHNDKTYQATLRKPIIKENPFEFQFEPSVTLLNTSLAGLRSLVMVRRAIEIATDATTELNEHMLEFGLSLRRHY